MLIDVNESHTWHLNLLVSHDDERLTVLKYFEITVLRSVESHWFDVTDLNHLSFLLIMWITLTYLELRCRSRVRIDEGICPCRTRTRSRDPGVGTKLNFSIWGKLVVNCNDVRCGFVLNSVLFHDNTLNIDHTTCT